MQTTDVLIIGGGATGAGTAWDLALRGVRVALADMGGIFTGTSGRYHGLLHSGARYAVTDPASAAECIQENTVLRCVVPQAIDDTGGLFVLVPGDDEQFVDAWVKSCNAMGITTNEIDPAEARRREPVLHPETLRAFEVPDAVCRSGPLGASLWRGIEAQGGTFLPYHQLERFHVEQGRVTGATLHNLHTGEMVEISCAMVVNAAGAWSGQVGARAGLDIPMQLSRGTMMALNGRWVSRVLNRLRLPGDGDIMLPLGDAGVIGTTSVKTDDPGDTRIEQWEKERLMDVAAEYMPALRNASIFYAWAGVRPLAGTNPTGTDGTHADQRSAARTFMVIDHEANDGVAGIATIVGGKLTTYRLMAEQTADHVCGKLGVSRPGQTATTQLPAA